MDNIDKIIKESISNILSEELCTNLTAFHGTPYDFIKFQNKNIGSGEGNQSFGFGLYFTSNKDVAQYYALTIGKGKGTIYTVKITDGQFFDWYKPLSDDFKELFIIKAKENNLYEMPIKRILTPNGIKNKNLPIEDAINYFPNGKFFYENLSLLLKSDRNASMFLADLGFVGIMYDVGSFLNKRTDGKNYVVFNDNDVEIINKEEVHHEP